MAPSPVGVLVLIVMVTTFNALLIGTTTNDTIFPEPEQPDGLLDILAGIIDTIWAVVVLIFDSITFNIGGAPFYIRFPLTMMIGGSLYWSISTLIRGN